MIFEFIWKDKYRVKRLALVGDIEDGGGLDQKQMYSHESLSVQLSLLHICGFLCKTSFVRSRTSSFFSFPNGLQLKKSEIGRN